MLSFFKWLLIVLGVVLVVACASTLIYQRVSDGPTGPLSGGPFTTGTPTPIEDWSDLEGDFEFELVNEGTSRTAGGIGLLLAEGGEGKEVYISCDLGFMWSRMPAGMTRNLLNVIYLFKDWHHDAIEDGRIRIRKGGKIYDASIELEEDPTKIAALKDRIEVLATEFFGGELGPRPTEPPNDVLFFRILKP